MAGGAIRIRTVTYGGLAALGLLTLIGATSLYFITHAVRRAAEALAGSSARLEQAEQLEAFLLVASRSKNLATVLGDATYRVQREVAIEEVHRELGKLAGTPASREEVTLLSNVEQLLRAWEASEKEADGARTLTDPRMARFQRSTDALFDATRSLVTFEEQQNARTRSRVRSWHQRAVAVAIVLTTAYLLIAGLYLALLRSMIFKPIEELDHQIARFSRGERRAHSPDGVLELRRLCETFNRMADTIGRQRQQQLSFLLAVAHDLRNPLSGLRAASATFRPGRPLPDEVALRKTLALLARQIASLDRLTDDLVDTVRVESGAFGLRLQPWDLRKAVVETAELYRTVSSQHELRVSLPNEAILARCDPVRVEQILNNLVSNAIKYSPAGGVIGIQLCRVGSMAELSVSDVGIGIAPEEFDRIFEPFHRGAGVRSTIPGVGIGLSVVRTLVLAHGGEIRVDSKPGEGSTFRVLLPLHTGADHPDAPSAELPAPHH